jgi:hypothetical protein
VHEPRLRRAVADETRGDAETGRLLVTTVWIVVGLGVAGAIAALVTSLRRRDPFDDLGAVSHQWIAEQRLGQTNDPRR